MIMTTVRMNVSSEKRNEVLEALRYIIEPIKVKPGCIDCRAYQDLVNPNAITWMEEWDSQKALDNHIRSEEYRIILVLMDMSPEPPEVHFNRVQRTAGLEVVQAIRGQEH